MEVTRHIVQFDVDSGTFPLLDVGPAGCEKRFDIRPVDTGLGGPLEDHLQGLAVFLSHTHKISYNDITFNGCVTTFKKRPENDGSSRPGLVSCNHFEQLVDELNLSPTRSGCRHSKIAGRIALFMISSGDQPTTH